jgi:2,5-diketo-D-gluconate reductase A
VLDDPGLKEITERLGKSPAQVVLRCHLERAYIVFPKSTTPARIEENFQLFDFELQPGDAEKIDALDRGEAGRDGPNPTCLITSPAEPQPGTAKTAVVPSQGPSTNRRCTHL